VAGDAICIKDGMRAGRWPVSDGVACPCSAPMTARLCARTCTVGWAAEFDNFEKRARQEQRRSGQVLSLPSRSLIVLRALPAEPVS
jgi:hypothetical protein